jgi:hypothetical protein
MADPEFRDWYQASDGLCLPHLRRAVDLSGTQASIRWLVEDASARLDLLLADVREYVRKQDWNRREEARLDKEQAAWVRSVAFIVGEAPKQEKERVYWLRAKARTDHELRPGRPLELDR